MTDLDAPTDGSTPATTVPSREPTAERLEVESLEQQLTEKPESLGRQASRAFLRNKLALVGMIALAAMILLAIVGPWLRPFGFEQLGAGGRNQGPSAQNWFGTDTIGRDLFVRATRGARTSLQISAIVAVISVTVGVVLGSIAGYVGRWVDGGISFVINLMITIPFYAVLLVFGVKYGGEPVTISLIIALFVWTRAARIVRSQFLALSQQEFVQAAKAAGARGPRIIFRHVLPHSVGPIVVEFTLTAGTAIILESTLSFLGLGILPPETSLGALVAENKGQFTGNPTAVLLPGGMITLIILSLNFIGDGLRDAFDPQSASRT